jgi:predicted HTH transcriptional regulator
MTGQPQDNNDSTAPLEHLLMQSAGPTLAFASERARLRELAETLVAFANTQGGTLLVAAPMPALRG